MHIACSAVAHACAEKTTVRAYLNKQKYDCLQSRSGGGGGGGSVPNASQSDLMLRRKREC